MAKGSPGLSAPPKNITLYCLKKSELTVMCLRNPEITLMEKYMEGVPRKSTPGGHSSCMLQPVLLGERIAVHPGGGGAYEKGKDSVRWEHTQMDGWKVRHGGLVASALPKPGTGTDCQPSAGFPIIDWTDNI